MAIGNRIKEQRLENNMTQVDLSVSQGRQFQVGKMIVPFLILKV